MDLFEFSCDLESSGITQNEIIKLLPPWKTRILEVVKTNEDFPTILLKFLINAKSIESVKSWIEKYQEQTLCTYYIRDTPFCKGRYLLFKQRLNCHHNTKTWNIVDPLNLKRKRRNTNCPSYIKVSLYSPVKVNKKRVRKHVPDQEMPCEIVLVPSHNHEINNAEALSWRRVSGEVKQKLIDLYDRGHDAATAREIIKLDIYMNENCRDILADRKFCPDYNYCYNLYRKHMRCKFKDEVGGESEMLNRLIRYLEKYNEMTNEDSCRFFQYGDDGSNYIICICPPLLRRVHEHIKASGDVIFLDSIKSNKTRKTNDSSRLYILLTPSECGGLPLGVVLTSENNSEALSNGFEILKDMLGEKLFRGKTAGPKIFITDDNVIERDAVKKSFPNSINLLCIYHVLQSIFRWLVKTKNFISETERQVFFQDFREVMFAKTKEECVEKYERARLNAEHCPNYLKLLEEYWGGKNLWALSHRSCFLSEAALRLLKEQIFERIKSFNMLQIVDFVLTKFMMYYEKKLLDAANKNLINYFRDTEHDSPPEHVSKRIQNLGNKLYLVPSETQENLFFIVNTDILSCSCLCDNCKHIEWSLAIQPTEDTITIGDEAIRRIFYLVALGVEPPSDWLEKPPLKELDEFLIVPPPQKRPRKILPKIPNDVFLLVTSPENKRKEVVEKINKQFEKLLESSPESGLECLEKFNEKLEVMSGTEMVSALNSFSEIKKQIDIVKSTDG